MRANEITPQKFYHGSMEELPVGTILTPRDNYEQNWSNTDFTLTDKVDLTNYKDAGNIISCRVYQRAT